MDRQVYEFSSRWLRTSVVMLIGMLVASGCQSAGSPTAPSVTAQPSPASSTNAAAQPTSAAPTAVAPTPAALTPATQNGTSAPVTPSATPLATPVAIATESPLNEAATQLDALTAYQVTLVLTASGTQGNQPFQESGLITHTLSSQSALEVEEINITGTGSGQQMTGTVYLRAGDKYFTRWSATAPCQSVSPEVGAGLFDAPATLLPDFSAAKDEVSEQVQGVASERYALSGQPSDVSGHVWVAKEGGYVDQASVSQDGALLSLGADVQGHAEWTYLLAGVNQTPVPDIPLSCRHVLGDLPMPTDATRLSATDPVLHYSTAMAAADLVSFYKDAMKKAGWSVVGDALVDTDGASMAFQQQSHTVLIGAVTSGTLTDVTVLYR